MRCFEGNLTEENLDIPLEVLGVLGDEAAVVRKDSWVSAVVVVVAVVVGLAVVVTVNTHHLLYTTVNNVDG